RGIYTGAIGYIAPHKKACFNVAIRTIHLKKSRAQLGTGGGIVYYSSTEQEYDEALLKSKFLTVKLPAFKLIESILWDKKYFFLKEHLRRLKNSADYFCIPFKVRALSDKLDLFRKELTAARCKVRASLSLEGAIHIEKELLKMTQFPVKLKVSAARVDPGDIFLYHKTTRRTLYDQEHSAALKEGFFEVVFLNAKGELTEGSFTNIFVQRDGKLYTPALKCGLLSGVLRSRLLSRRAAEERVLHLEDLAKAQKLYVGNSVRGLLPAQIFLADS
ncbi:MAG: aminotransferase class IV, partial [Candidatus Omnitrophica bacterium]|nr:aminotransferase class IV [Candidatus Omnitrophota bacterium]